jgi:hypothetical protein
MAPTSSKNQLLKQVRQRKYLNKDFDALKSDLLNYARTNFPEQIRDFSEASLGGLLLDFAAYTGDVTSFYLDHQFHELSIDTAVETRNIERLIRNAGVPIVGASPAVVEVTFTIEVPALGAPAQPNVDSLPIVHEGTVVRAQNGTQFELTEDIDFRELNNAGTLVADVVIGNRDASNNPTTFLLSLKGICISGFRQTDSFSVGSFEAFKRFTLSKENVTEVIRITDNLGNEYYEVDYLTQDTVYKAIPNTTSDNDLVNDHIIPIPAPYRFVKQTALQTRLTSLIFGGGSALTLNDDIIPDPSEFALPLYGKKVFSRFTLNPGNLLQTTTLGVIQPNSTISIEYRYGGGLNHNIGQRSIRGVTSLVISFPNNPTPDVSQFVRQSIDAQNVASAAGGDDAPTIDELKQRVPAVQASQGRIVTKEDLLARVYTMPSNFGRVFRASIQPDPNNPLAARLFVISRDANQRLIISPDSLKTNLRRFLNEYRLISDAIDILDAQVINIKINFSIVVDPNFNTNLVLQNVINRLKNFFSIKNFEIDQPIVIAEIQNIIFNNPGVLTVNSIELKNLTGTVGTTNPRGYSDIQFDVQANTDRGIILGPPGSIFELRYSNFDIVGVSV